MNFDISQEHHPERTCVGCFKRFPQSNLIALTRLSNGSVLFNLNKQKAGRSVYLCKNEVCFKRAFNRKGKNAFEYGLKLIIPSEVITQLQEYILSQSHDSTQKQ